MRYAYGVVGDDAAVLRIRRGYEYVEGDLQREFAVGWGLGRDGWDDGGGVVGGGADTFGLVGWEFFLSLWKMERGERAS